MADWGYIFVEKVKVVSSGPLGPTAVVVRYSSAMGNGLARGLAIFNANIGRTIIPPADPVGYAAWSAAREYLTRLKLLNTSL